MVGTTGVLPFLSLDVSETGVVRETFQYIDKTRLWVRISPSNRSLGHHIEEKRIVPVLPSSFEETGVLRCSKSELGRGKEKRF